MKRIKSKRRDGFEQDEGYWGVSSGWASPIYNYYILNIYENALVILVTKHS